MHARQNQNPDLHRNELLNGVRFARAYRECSPAIQRVIDRMVDIITDADVPDEEKEHALDTIDAAINPVSQADLNWGEDRSNSTASTGTEAEILQEEAAFSETLRRLMQAQNLTQDELSQRTGISPSVIANMLDRNCRPQRRTVVLFAETLGVTPDELWPARSHSSP